MDFFNSSEGINAQDVLRRAMTITPGKKSHFSRLVKQGYYRSSFLQCFFFGCLVNTYIITIVMQS